MSDDDTTLTTASPHGADVGDFVRMGRWGLHRVVRVPSASSMVLRHATRWEVVVFGGALMRAWLRRAWAEVAYWLWWRWAP